MLEVQGREAWQLSNRAQQQLSWGDSMMRESVRRRLQEGNSRENSGTVKFGIQWQSWSDQKEWGTTYKNNTNFSKKQLLIPGEEMNKKEEIVISIPLGLALSDVYRVMII